MSKLKIKNFQLLTMDEKGIRPYERALKFCGFPAKSAALRYDLGIKLQNAIVEEYQNFEKMRVEVLKELCINKKVVLKNEKGEQNEIDTKQKIVDAPKEHKGDFVFRIDGKEVEGKKIISNEFDLGDNRKEFDKRFAELLELDVELNCYPIKLSKLEADDNFSAWLDENEITLAQLEPYIEDDRK